MEYVLFFLAICFTLVTIALCIFFYFSVFRMSDEEKKKADEPDDLFRQATELFDGLL